MPRTRRGKKPLYLLHGRPWQVEHVGVPAASILEKQRMPRTPSGRKHLYPLHGGPWLVERVSWFFGGMTLAGVVLTLGTGFVCGVLWKEARNAFSLFLLVAGVILAIGGPLIGGLAWLLIRTGQTCPECLRGMNRGAYVCPWCGFRETP